MISATMAAQAPSTRKPRASLTATLEALERAHWDAYKRVDAAAHNSILTDDYLVIDPYGNVHHGKPTAQQIAATPIGAYAFEDFHAETITSGVALATFVADVEVPGHSSHFRFIVSEVWLEANGKWFQRSYQATLLK